MSHNTTQTGAADNRTALPLHGGNVYLPTPADLMDDEANSAAFDLLVDGGIVAIALLIIMVGVCAVMGYSWAHLVALLP